MSGTLMYEVEKHNGVWYATKQLQVENEMVTYDGVTEMKVLVEHVPVSFIKDLLSLVNYRSKVFECHLVAPSRIVWIIWIDFDWKQATTVKSSPIVGCYLSCTDPEKISEETYQRLIEY